MDTRDACMLIKANDRWISVKVIFRDSPLLRRARVELVDSSEPKSLPGALLSIGAASVTYYKPPKGLEIIQDSDLLLKIYATHPALYNKLSAMVRIGQQRHVPMVTGWQRN